MWLRGLYRRARALLRSEAIHREIDEELRFHVEMRAEENVRRGMRPEEARREAERRFGNFGHIKERAYEVRGGGMLETLLQDIRYGARVLGRNKSFTAAAVLTLALGVGANSAIFSVVNSVLLRPLPFDEPERLVRVYEKRLKLGRTRNVVSAPDFLDWRAQNKVFDSVSAYTGWSTALTGGDEPRQVTGTVASADLFRVLRAAPMMGRVFGDEEDRPGAARVVVISRRMWEGQFGADPSILGKTIRLDGVGHTVVGVMPADFEFPDRETELWAPLALNAQEPGNRGSHYLNLVARLRDGVSLEAAQAEMEGIAARLEEQHPVNVGHSVNIFPLHDEVVGAVRPALLLLLGVVGFVLLIACANVANLLLARGASRQTEIAIRTALGAGRRRVLRQLLTESVMLALAGGALGLLLSAWGVESLLKLIPADMPRASQIGVDRWVLGFTALVSVATGVLFGLLPALQVSKSNLHDALKEGGRGPLGGGGGQSRLRGILVVTEVAAALVLLVGAGLLAESLVRLRRVNPGFDPSNVLTMQLSLPPSKYKEPAQQAAFLDEVLRRAESLPGVRAAGAVASLPMGGNSASRYFQIEGRPPRPAGEGLNTRFNLVSANYFRALGVALKGGRHFDAHDTKGAPDVVLINETMARQFWPDEDPLGKRLRIGENPWRTVVGVVGDVKNDGLNAETKAEMFYPLSQSPLPFMTLVVRSETDPAALAASVRREVQEVDKEQPVYDVKTMEQRVAESVSSQRLTTLLVSLFAALAVTLSAIGIYGVISYTVARRTHEIGVRIALGARRADVLRLVVGQGMKMVLAGVVLGLAGALALTRLVSSFFFGVSAADPLVYGGVSLLLVAVALLACLIPARRAAKTDPMVALRYE
jgi:predicted permease